MSAASSASTPNLPYPLMVNALTGASAPAVPLENLSASDLPGADQRIANSKNLATDYSVDDPNDLTQAGWGILFASDADPAIQAQLQPLIDLRQKQVQDPNLFKVFSGSNGVLPGQTADSWAQQRGVSLTAAVDPYQGGVPYYLLIVGSPDRISFEFQALLKMQWVVGRLAFDDVEDYGRYAQAVVEYESASFRPVQRKNAAVWVTRNYGDLATAMLSGAVCQDFLSSTNQLGSRSGFNVDGFPNEKATKAQLTEILRGNLPGGPPAVFFTGSHGCDYTAPASPTNQFSADDIPADAKLQGTFGFLFACYSGGCPTTNSYSFNKDGSPITIAPAPMISRLPQALLSHGTLALIAHVDLAFPYAFQNVSGTPQMQAVRTPLELLMRGKRAGLAADSLSILWSSLSSQLSLALGSNAASPSGGAGQSVAASGALAQMTIARDDARNYIVLGDPATKLRIADLR